MRRKPYSSEYSTPGDSGRYFLRGGDRDLGQHQSQLYGDTHSSLNYCNAKSRAHVSGAVLFCYEVVLDGDPAPAPLLS